jgi:hypothetical protein
MQTTTAKYFTGSLWFTVFAMATGAGYGFYINGIHGALLATLYMTALSIVEISLSFDNAIANARVLGGMSPKWQHRFITWGMIIAVFGMRVVFPVLIVAIVGHKSILQAIIIGFTDHALYQEIMESSHIMIGGFGGSFLFLVALGFFFDKERDIYWIHFLEKKLQQFGRLASAEIIFTLLVIIAVSASLPTSAEQMELIIAGIWGIITHELVGSVGEFTGEPDAAATAKKAGAAGFIYLEILDASFSFDGVIGAFAITNDIVIIALGLAIGAMFVRSLTIMLVEKKTMSQFRFLEHGAFWSILVLALVMIVGTLIHIPEWLVALSAIATIGASYLSSMRANKAELLKNL